MRIEQEHIEEAVDAIGDVFAYLDAPGPDFNGMMQAIDIDEDVAIHLLSVINDLDEYTTEQKITFAFITGVISARKAMG